MAVQYDINVRGRIGNVIYFKRGEGHFAKSAPGKYKQTKATKAQATVFGKASQTASFLWQMLKPWAKDAADNTTWNRLNTAIAAWLRTNPLTEIQPQNNLPFITGFAFNEQTSLIERLKVPLQISRTGTGILQLTIPDLNPTKQIAAPAHTKTITIQIIACSCSMTGVPAMANFVTDIQMPYTDTLIPAQQVQLPVITAAVNITVVAMALQYSKDASNITGMVSAKRWMPAGIVAAFYN